jgi:hypothetical protein
MAAGKVCEACEGKGCPECPKEGNPYEKEDEGL